MNTEQVRQHQQDSHKLGAAPHKKVASELRLFDSAGKPAWHIVQYAENPPGTLRSIERYDLLKEIKPQAMAAEQLGRTLNDKEWHKMALQSKWQLLQASSRHMGVDLARYAHIQDFGDGATTAIASLCVLKLSPIFVLLKINGLLPFRFQPFCMRS